MRRHTEAGEAARWLPIPRSPIKVGGVIPSPKYRLSCAATFPIPQITKESDESDTRRISWLPILPKKSPSKSECRSTNGSSNLNISNQQGLRTQSGRSYSADVQSFFIRQDSGRFRSPSQISYRWMPEAGMSMSRYIPSPLQIRRTSESDNVRTPPQMRWSTYSKTSTHSPKQKKFNDRRFSSEAGKRDILIEEPSDIHIDSKSDILEEEHQETNEQGFVYTGLVTAV